jgi:hypothetical protein
MMRTTQNHTGAAHGRLLYLPSNSGFPFAVIEKLPESKRKGNPFFAPGFGRA